MAAVRGHDHQPRSTENSLTLLGSIKYFLVAMIIGGVGHADRARSSARLAYFFADRLPQGARAELGKGSRVQRASSVALTRSR